jgi:hypothetical protein
MASSLLVESNETVRRDSPSVLGMPSELGREPYVPNRIRRQTAEACFDEFRGRVPARLRAQLHAMKARLG